MVVNTRMIREYKMGCRSCNGSMPRACFHSTNESVDMLAGKKPMKYNSHQPIMMLKKIAYNLKVDFGAVCVLFLADNQLLVIWVK